jgi:hypothetical protein
MILISHRGNIRGRIESLENDPEYVLKAIKSGFNCLVDLWFDTPIKGDVEQFFTGNNEPVYPVDSEFMDTKGILFKVHTDIAFEMMQKFWNHTVFYKSEEFDFPCDKNCETWTIESKDGKISGICSNRIALWFNDGFPN